MATFVLVHGGGHGGWCYAKVRRRLQEHGHTVFAPSLTGCGDRAHVVSSTVDLDTHITDIVQLLFFEDLTDVILVGHSYGGMVITGVADRAADRIGKLVYLDAANPRDGQSLIDVAGEMILATRPLGTTVDGVELVLLPAPGAGAFYGVEDPDDLAWMDPRLTPHPWKTFEQPLRLDNPGLVDAIADFHIVCAAPMLRRDTTMIDAARPGGRVWEIDTGHDLMITEPDLVTDALVEIAAR